MSKPSASLVPIWGIGLAGVVAGLAFTWHVPPNASGTSSSPDLSPVDFPAMPSRDELEPESSDTPVTLRYRRDGERPTMIAVEHVSRASDAEHRFRARFEGWRHRFPRHTSGRSLLTQRQQYDSVQLELFRNGDPVAHEYLESVERNLRGTSVRHVLDDVGDLREEVSNDPGSATADALLSTLMTRTLGLLMPRLRGDRLLPGETWVYAFPLRRPGASPSGLEHGHIDVRVDFEGVTRRGQRPFAVLRTRLEFSALGPNSTSKERRNERQGHGEGGVLFDLEAGAIETSWLQVTYRSEHVHAEDDRTHDIRLYLGTPDHDTI